MCSYHQQPGVQATQSHYDRLGDPGSQGTSSSCRTNWAPFLGIHWGAVQSLSVRLYMHMNTLTHIHTCTCMTTKRENGQGPRWEDTYPESSSFRSPTRRPGSCAFFPNNIQTKPRVRLCRLTFRSNFRLVIYLLHNLGTRHYLVLHSEQEDSTLPPPAKGRGIGQSHL